MPDLSEEPIPFRLIARHCPIQQRVDGLVSKAKPPTAAHADSYVPLSLQAAEERQRGPVLGPDFYRVFPVVLWFAALGHLGIGFEVCDGGGAQFPSTPSVQALR